MISSNKFEAQKDRMEDQPNEPASEDSDVRDGTLPPDDEKIVQDVLDNWKEPITVRACIVGVFFGFFGAWILLKIGFTSPITPSLAVPLGLFAYLTLRKFTQMVSSALPFTKQENTVAQTIGNYSAGSTIALGYSSYYGALSDQFEEEYPGTTVDISNPKYAFATSIALIMPGIFLITYMRQWFLKQEYLIFPSGTASGISMKTFHEDSKEVQELVKQQLYVFMKWFGICALFQLFTVSLNSCEPSIPLFGTEVANAHSNLGGWDMNIVFIGVGLLMSPDFCFSIAFWLLTVPFFTDFLTARGSDDPYLKYPDIGSVWNASQIEYAEERNIWYSTAKTMQDGMKTPSIRGFLAYLVFPFAFVMVGECAVYIFQAGVKFCRERRKLRSGKDQVNESMDSTDSSSNISDVEFRADMRRRQISSRATTLSAKVGLGIYLVLSIVGTLILTFTYNIDWWMVLISFWVWAPFIAVPNVIFIGIQDQDMSAILGKLTMFIIPLILVAATGNIQSSVVSGLIAEGVIVCISFGSAALMQDFKTAYYTETSPRTMMFAQIIAGICATVIGPLAWITIDAELGVNDPARFKQPVLWEPYRGIAVTGAYGADLLPVNAWAITGYMTFAGLVMTIAREYLPKLKCLKEHGWLVKYVIPNPTAFVIVLYVQQATNSDYPIGAAMGLLWKLHNPLDYANFHQIFAAAMIVAPNFVEIVMGLIQAIQDPTPVQIYCYGAGLEL